MDRAKVGKYGKYKPFIILSIITALVGVGALFFIPEGVSPVIAVIWVIFFYLLYDVGSSFYAPNLIFRTLTLDQNERGKLLIRPETREVFFDGQPVLLSSKEYALLVALADRPGVVLSRGQLEEKLYNWDSTVGSNAIEVHIHHLRKKLSNDAIKTVRGVGYLLET
jgi:hypothetical protein